MRYITFIKKVICVGLVVLIGAATPCGATTPIIGTPLTGYPTSFGDNFGSSVANNNSYMLVGASKADPSGLSSGIAHLFDASGAYLRELSASDGQQLDEFGASVAMAGTDALVGAFLEDEQADRAGAVYVFDTNTGVERFKLTASDAESVDFFGGNVAGTTGFALVGARGNDDAGEDSGSAYIFNLDTGAQLHKLVAPDAAAEDRFGTGLAIDSRYAVVGANHVRFTSPDTNNGAAYVYDTTTGDFIRKLIPDDLSSLDGFGQSIALAGDYVVVGTRLSNAAYVFDVTTGEQLHKFTSPIANFNFGNAVAASGHIALVGVAPSQDSIVEVSAYDMGTGELLHNLYPSEHTTGGFGQFGFSVSLSGKRAIIGHPAAGIGGLSYTYNIPEPSCFALFLTALCSAWRMPR